MTPSLPSSASQQMNAAMLPLGYAVAQSARMAAAGACTRS